MSRTIKIKLKPGAKPLEKPKADLAYESAMKAIRAEVKKSKEGR